MERVFISGGTLITPARLHRDCLLVIEDGQIVEIEPGKHIPAAGKNEKRVTANGCWVAPGLIDLHVHGGAGYDVMDASPEALQAMSIFFAKHGVTSFLGTTLSSSAAALAKAISSVEQFKGRENGAACLGVHLEGPYFSPDRAGAQPLEHLRLPERREYSHWLESKIVKRITLAPELPGSLELIKEGVSRGIRFAAGHTRAAYEQMLAAVDLGLNQAAHTFNGMDSLHHHEPGVVGAVLDDERIYAEAIADGIHLHPVIIRLIIRAKGCDKVMLVTDAMRAAGLPDGIYDLGGQDIHVHEAVSRTASGGLAGSTLTLDCALRNMLKFGGISLKHAVTMAARVPAEAMGWQEKKGAIQVGADADLILLDAGLQVRATFVKGNLVFDQREPA